MRLRYRVSFLAVTLAACVAGWRAAPAWRPSDGPAPSDPQQTAYNAVTLSSQAVGHQYRQDDWPAIAAAPDGSLWVAWLSFDGEHDDVAIRHFQDGKWSNLHWVPNTSGDNWLPQVAVDASNRPWVVWSQQLDGNWDLYARRFDPAKQEWGDSSGSPPIRCRISTRAYLERQGPVRARLAGLSREVQQHFSQDVRWPALVGRSPRHSPCGQ